MALNDVTFPVAAPVVPDAVPTGTKFSQADRDARDSFRSRLENRTGRPASSDRTASTERSRRSDRTDSSSSAAPEDDARARTANETTSARGPRNAPSKRDSGRTDDPARSTAPVDRADDAQPLVPTTPQPAAIEGPADTEAAAEAIVEEVVAYIVQATQGAPPSGVTWSGLETGGSASASSTGDDSTGTGLTDELRRILEELIATGKTGEEDESPSASETEEEPEVTETNHDSDDREDEGTEIKLPLVTDQAIAIAFTEVLTEILEPAATDEVTDTPVLLDDIAAGAEANAPATTAAEQVVAYDPTAVDIDTTAAETGSGSFQIPVAEVTTDDEVRAPDDLDVPVAVDKSGTAETKVLVANHREEKRAKHADEPAAKGLTDCTFPAAPVVAVSQPTPLALDVPKGHDGQATSSVNAVDSTDDSANATQGTAPHPHEPMRDINVPTGDSSLRVGSSEFTNRLARAIDACRPNGELAVRLNPPSFGAMQIEVTMQNGELSARLSVESPQAQQLIHDTLPQLRESLAKIGASVERIDVHLAPQRTEASSQSDQPRGESGRESSSDRQNFGGDPQERGHHQRDSERREQTPAQAAAGEEPTNDASAPRTGRTGALGMDRIDLVM